MGIQMVRAADSIGANIAEAQGRWHRQEQRRFLYIARGSLYELEHWVELAQERGLLPAEASTAISELARTLNGLIKNRPSN
jgi:four helix bundle protein